MQAGRSSGAGTGGQFMLLDRNDSIQKTWIPEGTSEYLNFKQRTGENRYLASLLKRQFTLAPTDLVLDVGGREGEIAYALQDPQCVHIVDPDPTIDPSPPSAQFWNCRIQDVTLSDNYSLIICSHVLGYLGKQHAQLPVIMKLLQALKPGGTLVLFYNRNTGYMHNLLSYSLRHLDNGHYDYFDEAIFCSLAPEYRVTSTDVWFYPSFPNLTSLSRCCWFLFGSLDQDIGSVANIFLPKLKDEVRELQLPIEQRVAFIEKPRRDSL